MSASKRFAVVGNPVAHSLSPQIHGHFAAQGRIDLTYERLLLEPKDFVAGVDRFFAAGGAGLNVTVPFKQSAYALAPQHDDLAAAAQAVNTLAPEADGLRGYNTDGVGLCRDLQQNLGLTLQGRSLVLLGAGGSARGVLAPLLACAPRRLLLANRTAAKAAALALEFAPYAAAHAVDLQALTLDALPQGVDLIINATASSLHGASADLFPAHIFAGAHCYDLMYGPATEFCETALAQGASATWDGLGMLVEQAALAFAIWHGLRPDTAEILAQLRAQGKGRALVAGAP